MITDEEVKRISNDILMRLANNVQPGEVLPTQIFRGMTAFNWPGQHPGACERHMQVFTTFNAIPEYCFGCLKIVVKPRNVIELIKLFLVFNEIYLPNDNTRKCLVECRENIAGTYTGLVYCRGIDEAQQVFELVDKAVMEQISEEVPVSIKRGCSEFGIAYPEYARVTEGRTEMDYKAEWAEFEAIMDRDFAVDEEAASLPTYNKSDYTVEDAKAMYCWLMYAATIGDSSYLEVSGGNPLPALTNINRPPFEG